MRMETLQMKGTAVESTLHDEPQGAQSRANARRVHGHISLNCLLYVLHFDTINLHSLILSVHSILKNHFIVDPESLICITKMPSIRKILPVLAAAASVEAAMGPAFSTGPVGSGSWIRESTSTLVLPKAPSGSSGDASLWVGMGTSNGDLIQSIADNWSSSTWSIFAYTLQSTGPTSQMPVQTDGTNAVEGEKITMHCEYQD